MSTTRKITLIEEEEGGWSAIDEELGVASCGETRAEALEMLDEALALHQDDGEPIEDEDEDAVLEELGLDPDDVDDKPLPDFMQ